MPGVASTCFVTMDLGIACIQTQHAEKERHLEIREICRKSTYSAEAELPLTLMAQIIRGWNDQFLTKGINAVLWLAICLTGALIATSQLLQQQTCNSELNANYNGTLVDNQTASSLGDCCYRCQVFPGTVPIPV